MSISQLKATLREAKQYGDWRKALDVLDRMQEQGVKPDSQNYSSAIAACGNARQWERAV
ncbi:unnamed protein product, partial [Ectocarpus sp. 12 AP-2014]